VYDFPKLTRRIEQKRTVSLLDRLAVVPLVFILTALGLAGAIVAM